jgi:hypothetical protein
MGGTCSTYWGYTQVESVNMKERGHFGDLGVDGNMVLEYIFET